MQIANRVLPPGAKPTTEPMKWLPQMPLAERDRRWRLIRRKMTEAGVDALIVLGTDIFWGMGTANNQYLFHLEAAPASDGLFPLEGQPVVWMGAPQLTWPFHSGLCVQQWCTDVRTRRGMAAIADEIRARGLDRSRLGLVGYASTIQTTPVYLKGDLLTLEKLLPQAQFVDSAQMLQDARLVKSEDEISMLRRAAGVAEKTLQAMIDTARPGITEAAVYGEMIKTHIANGGEPSFFILLGSGPVEHPSEELWSLLHGGLGPKVPTMRPLNVGDMVIAEWHTKFGGYRCHTECSVYLGKKAPKQLLRIWDVSLECLQASQTALRAGNTLGAAWREIRAPAERAGLDWVELGWHAMGIGSPEFPTVIFKEGFGHHTLNGHGIEDFVLEEGMAFGNNVDLHDGTWKPDVGLMIGGFMVVRPGQAEALVKLPKELPQVG